MLVMPANNTKGIVHYWAGKFGHLGHIYSPAGWREPVPWLPYVLANGAWTCHTQGTPFDAAGFLGLCDKAAACGQPPMWVAAPDVVADKEETLALWPAWELRLRGYGWPVAFIAQDGMTPGDVPSGADLVFIGGSTAWKWSSLHAFCQAFARVHVGRVNGERGLWECYDAGAESCDGTGWFRGDAKQLAGLERYLRAVNGERHRPVRLPLTLAGAV